MRTGRLTLIAFACTWLAVACSDDGGGASSTGLECGSGTVPEDGSCVPENELRCGEGTVEQDGDCVPEETIECGPGTQLEYGTCVPVEPPPIECWEGTVLVGGACVPDGSACEQGTVFNEATGRCELDPDLCGAGTVSLGGECVPEDEALTADHEESDEPNDTGTAGTVTAPAFGENTTLHGCITPNGGEPDQDVWQIHATQPMLLDITADGVGGLSAAFSVTSTDEKLGSWQRRAISLANDTAHRQVYLPVAGDYALVMSSTQALLNGSAAGSAKTCYFTTIEHVALPAPTELPVPEVTKKDDGNVRVLRYVAAEDGAVLDLIQTALSSAVKAGYVALKNGAFYGASMPFGDQAYLTVGGLATGDQVDVIVDLANNWTPSRDAYELRADAFDVAKLPTDGAALTLTKHNGDTPANPPANFNYSYFDVPSDGQVVGFELTSSVPVNLVITRERVFGGTGLDAIATVSQVGTGSGISTFSGQFVRFAKAGRYYVVTADPTGTSGATYTLTSKLTMVPTTPVTYGVPMTSQALPAPGSAFFSLDTTGARWLEATVPSASSFGGGQARISFYDLSGEGWLDQSYLAVQSGTQPTNGSAPLGRVVAGDERNYLVRVEDTGAPGADPTFTLSVGERPHVLLGAGVPGTPIVRTGVDTAAASGTVRYLVSGSGTHTLSALVTPAQAGVDVRVDWRNADESIAPGGTFDAGAAGITETLVAPHADDAWTAFTVTNKSAVTSTALNLVVTTSVPRPYVVSSSPTLAYVNACTGGSVITLSEDDEGLSSSLTLPASFASFALFGDTVGQLGVRISSNGWFTFGAASDAKYDPDPIPTAAAPNSLVAPFWTDLDQVVVCRKDDAVAGTVTFQWTGGLFSRSEDVEFQAVLHTNGVIDFIYGPNHLASVGANKEAIVGVENLAGSFGSQLAENLTDLGPNRSWTLTPE